MPGRWGCGSCGYVGFWLKVGLRFHQRFTCPGQPNRTLWDITNHQAGNHDGKARFFPTCPWCNNLEAME